MSGRLVGQVIAASPVLQERGLSKNGFLALLAIAEKCTEKNMQASVPWIHLSHGLYGASKRTVVRTVGELKDAGLVRVVKRGWANQHGDAQAPIYELCLAPPVAQTNCELCAKSGELCAKSGELCAMQGGALNGSTNGSTNGDRRPRNKRDAVRLCTLCDDRGNRYLGDRYVKCDHKPEQGAA
jgi:hypothetical protein